jgi:hypothetical protein
MQADYPSVGKPVNPTKFLPMKTPMSLEIISNWSLEQPPKHSLTVPELLCGQDLAGRCVGMIIDLANHECLYAEDLPDSLEYTHIQLVAKVLPPPEAINAVAAAAAEFWSRRPNDYISIHCAYGFNRTGFVVCSYLCQECGMTVPEALESFAQARPPGVKHGKFVDELYARYGSSSISGISGTGYIDMTIGEDNSSQISNATTVAGIATATVGGGDCDPPASPSSGNAARHGETGTPRSGLLLVHLIKGSGNSNSSTPAAGSSFSRREEESVDGGGSFGGGYRAWKEERANSMTASEEGYPSSASLSLLGACVGSPSASNSLPIPSPSSGRGSLRLDNSRRSSSRSLLAVAEEKDKNNNSSIGTLQEVSAIGGAKDASLSNNGGRGGGGEKKDKLIDNDSDDFLKPRTSGQWSEMAQQVDGKNLLRKETSLGLAKALHEDFGVHDSTPSRDAPSPLMKKLGVEEAAEREDARERADDMEVDVESRVRKLQLLDEGRNYEKASESNGGGDGNDAEMQSAFATVQNNTFENQSAMSPLPANNSRQKNTITTTEAEVPSSTPPSATSLQQQPWSTRGLSSNEETIITSPAPSGAAPPFATPSGILLAPSPSDIYMPRNMSFESDCHSLGFNAREAITNLRAQQSGVVVVGASLNRQYSVASDLDTTLWETSEDEGGSPGDGSGGKPKKVLLKRQLPQEQRRDCCLM